MAGAAAGDRPGSCRAVGVPGGRRRRRARRGGERQGEPGQPGQEARAGRRWARRTQRVGAGPGSRGAGSGRGSVCIRVYASIAPLQWELAGVGEFPESPWGSPWRGAGWAGGAGHGPQHPGLAPGQGPRGPTALPGLPRPPVGQGTGSLACCSLAVLLGG